jgi:hypothetical protein
VTAMCRLARESVNAAGELVSAPGGSVTDEPDLSGGSRQERPLQT